jgi:hypothetical protein
VEGHPRVEGIERRLSEFHGSSKNYSRMITCSLLGIVISDYLPISTVKIVRRKIISRELGSEEMLIVEKRKGAAIL